MVLGDNIGINRITKHLEIYFNSGFCGVSLGIFSPGAHKEALLGSWGAEDAAGDEQPHLGRCTGCCSGSWWLQDFSQLISHVSSVKKPHNFYWFK